MANGLHTGITALPMNKLFRRGHFWLALKASASYSRVPGFTSQLQLLTLPSYSQEPREAVLITQIMGLLLPTDEYLAPGFSAVVGICRVNKQMGDFLSLSKINT